MMLSRFFRWYVARRPTRCVQRGVVFATIAGGVLLASPPSSLAASSSPGWTIRALSAPTSFSAQDSLRCPAREEEGTHESKFESCDRYTLLITNAGASATPEEDVVTIADELPSGLRVKAVYAEEWENEARSENEEAEERNGEIEPGSAKWHCTTTPLRCTFKGKVPAGDVLEVTVAVEVEVGAAGTLPPDKATVEGGGARAQSTSVRTAVEAEPQFGFADFGLEPYAADGTLDAQAGDHPYELTSSFDFNTVAASGPAGLNTPVEDVKDLVTYLPFGLVGDPQALPQCPQHDVEPETCPSASRIGTVAVSAEGGVVFATAKPGTETSALYNVVPEHGYPAEFGFFFFGKAVFLYADVVRVASGYALRVAAPGIPRLLSDTKDLLVNGVSLTFFGDPAKQDGNSNSPAAYFTNPSSCSDTPLNARIEADSWTRPSTWASRETTVYPQLTGCNLLQFQPTLEVAPETTQADEPSGYTVDLKVPQAPNLAPALATPDLRDATVTLPQGVSVSPSAADGLTGCAAEGPVGINIGSGELSPEGADLRDPLATELGAGGPEGNGSPYEDRLYHTAPGHCPAASMLGTVEITTPLLASPLHGHVYLAQPKCGGEGQAACTEASASNGELFGLYIEAEGSGVIIKLPGTTAANPTTGQLTATFSENPQLPFSDLKLKFNGGPRAPLANPQACGAFTTSAQLVPWSSPETPTATPFSSFAVPCEGMPFDPSFEAGTTLTDAGAYSPFTLTFSRKDREQDLSAIAVQTPPGLLGKIAGVPQCGEAQANAGTCGPESQIGTTTAATGSGSAPLYLGGRVYLTGPYDGRPFGLSIVVPAVAGPFNLGNVVVRASIAINPYTAAITAVSGPLPQIIDGVPTRLQTVNVTLNRPGFMFNPTNCDAQAVTATISSAQGASANVSAPFAAAGCKNLPFKPDFSASTTGKTSKALGASLNVKITSASLGQANIAKVDVEIPKALPTQLKTLNHACTEAQFNSNPANCPPASDIAQVTVHTPLLNSPLKGPAYLVSHGGAAFPDVELVLQGEGVELVIDGHTQIKKGVTYSHFETVPDAPFTSFEFDSPQGELALFTAYGDLCDQKLVMPTSMTGQNGAVLTQNTPVEVEGCSSSLSIVASKVKKRTLTLSVYAPGAGKVTASGKGLSSGSKAYSGREALTFNLKQKRAGKLTTEIKLTFTPSKGKKQTKRVKAAFNH
jgi:hypothetical protein